MGTIYQFPLKRKLTRQSICLGYLRLLGLYLLLAITAGAVLYAFTAFIPWIDNRRPVEWERFQALFVAEGAFLAAVGWYLFVLPSRKK